MYIGKHRNTPFDEEAESAQSIQIPQNYAGNAFSAMREEERCERDKECTDACEADARLLPACVDAQREKSGFFTSIDRLFSSDALLILLAILLAGSEDGGELAVILLLLLLF